MIEAWSDATPWSPADGRACNSLSRLERREHASHPHDRVTPFGRPAAVGRAAARGDLQPRESFVRNGELQVGRLGDNRRVGLPGFHQRLGAGAFVLFVDDAGDDELATRPGGSEHRRGAEHGGDAAFHVLRTAAVKTPVVNPRRERRVHPLNTDGVEVAAQHHRRTGLATFEHTDHVGPARQYFLHLDVHPRRRHERADNFRRRGFARRAGHQRRVDRVVGDQIGEEGDDWIHYCHSRAFNMQAM